MNETFAKARRLLSRRDAALKTVIRTVGPCTLQPDDNHFVVLVRSILSQQISTKAAASIWERVAKQMGGIVTPRKMLQCDADTLRSLGVSQSKQRSMHDLAEKCASGEVPLKKLKDLGDEEVIDLLVPVRGIGRWTAEMFLMFSLGRLDVLPVGDYGLRAGAQKLYQLADLPGRKELEALALPWQPYRSLGTWYVWRSLSVPATTK